MWMINLSVQAGSEHRARSTDVFELDTRRGCNIVAAGVRRMFGRVEYWLPLAKRRLWIAGNEDALGGTRF